MVTSRLKDLCGSGVLEAVFRWSILASACRFAALQLGDARLLLLTGALIEVSLATSPSLLRLGGGRLQVKGHGC